MVLLEKYIGEAKRKKAPKKKAIPKVKGKGKYHFGIKKDPEGWYQQPKMMGHRWSKETVDALEKVLNTYSKSKQQKWIINSVYGSPQDVAKIDGENSWHYFNNITKKDIAILQFVLRKADSMKSDYAALLRNVGSKTGMLKNRLTWALEVLAYKHDKEAYLQDYIKNFGFYGMDKEEAEDRFERYHKGIMKKIDGQDRGLMGR